MLKKIIHYSIYGGVIVFTLQYFLFGTLSPYSVFSDLKGCLFSGNCGEKALLQSSKKELPVLDTITRSETEKEREAILTSFETDVIDSTNKERISQSLQPLIPQDLLARSARVKALDMYEKQYFEHDSPEGKGVSDLAKDVGYDFLIVGENLALGDFKNPQAVVDAWMNSKGHRENILNPKYREIGVSMISGTYNGKQALFIVQHFGTNRSVCPRIDTRLKDAIDETARTLKGDELTIEELKKTIESEKNIFSVEYGKNVTAFNTLIQKYNALLEISRNQITEYNKEVRAFNACLSEFQ